MDTLTTTSNANLTIGDIGTQAKQFIIESTSEATRKAYRSDLRIFANWCNAQNFPAMPTTPETIANFLAEQSSEGISPSTLNRRIAAIQYAHETAGMNSPTKSKLVSSTLKGIRRTTSAKVEKKAAATTDKIYSMIARCNTETMQGKRDKAVLLLGFAGAFRRSELAGLELSDIAFVTDGAKITIRKSKTDQESQGQTIAIYNGRLNVVGILQDYIQAAGITEGALFRPISKSGNLRLQPISDKSVAEIVKKYAQLAGLDPNQFAGHSLRAGFITSAAEAGANLFKIMDVSRHKSVQTVKGYVRNAELFKDHAGSSFL